MSLNNQHGQRGDVKKLHVKGFTIIEALVTLFIFAILAAGMIGIYSVLSRNVRAAREKTVLSSLASNYLEIIRNMPYSQVGTLNGNPHGNLPDLANAYVQTIEGIKYKIYYEVTYIDDPADGTILAGTDAAPDDYKQVKMDILNANTGIINSFVTNASPQGLEGIINAGALFIKVINSQGQPVSGANIHITYPTTTPTIILDRQSDASGQWVEVGLPAAVNNYHILVTKTGYSSDQTYQITSANPNPTKPDSTIVNGSVTQITFSIDLIAGLTFKTLNSICQPQSGINLNVVGAKLIGTSPNVLKFNTNYSSAAGQIVMNNLEWDTYTPTLLTGQSVIVRGTSPIQKIDVLPNTAQTFTMILGTNSTANSLLVIVKDGASGTALENALVTLKQGATTVGSFYTGGSVWVQNDWSSGGGQTDWSTSSPSSFSIASSSIDTSTSGLIQLKKTGSVYSAGGDLTSSSFDTGTSATNYTILSWQPPSQSASTTLAFQLAANNDDATWNFIGPDGTGNTFFTTPGTDVGSFIDNKRYVRYRAFLTTVDTTKTPVMSNVSVNFVTGCFTPGQVIFTDLATGSYSVSVVLSGYTTQTINAINVNGNQALEVLMSP